MSNSGSDKPDKNPINKPTMPKLGSDKNPGNNPTTSGSNKNPANKPDTKPRDRPDISKLNINSPISTLPSQATGAVPTTSSSSSSSGSVSSRSRKLGFGPRPRPFHEFSSTVSSFFRSGLKSSGSQFKSSKPFLGNICPSGNLSSGIMASQPVKPDVLGTGKGIYGHGSVMRGTTGVGRSSASGSGGSIPSASDGIPSGGRGSTFVIGGGIPAGVQGSGIGSGSPASGQGSSSGSPAGGRGSGNPAGGQSSGSPAGGRGSGNPAGGQSSGSPAGGQGSGIGSGSPSAGRGRGGGSPAVGRESNIGGGSSGSGRGSGSSGSGRGSTFGTGGGIPAVGRESNIGGGSSDSGQVRDPEECKKLGNEKYKVEKYSEALEFYDQAIEVSPNNAIYRFNKGMALMGMHRIADAAKQFEEAIRLYNGYVKAHLRLGSLCIRLGQVENAKRHLFFRGVDPDPSELNKLEAVDTILKRCSRFRKAGEWKYVVKDVDAAIAAGADSSPQLYACKAEAFLKLYQLEEATRSLSNVPKPEDLIPAPFQPIFFGIPSVPYLLYVWAKYEMAFGRLEAAFSLAEKALKMDPKNLEVSILVNNMRLSSKLRNRGNDLYKAARYTEACTAYSEGLKIDPSNSILYCNRAACWYNLGQWILSFDDSNEALRMQPNYTKALLRRAASNAKLERWADAVRDYEILRKEFPEAREVAEGCFFAQVSLRKSRGEDVSNMKFGGDVEFVLALDQFKAAISYPGVSVVCFKTANNIECRQISPFLDELCGRYPTINFLKVEIDQSPAIATAENVKFVPTLKIYKAGKLVKQMICPKPQVLETSVRHYSLV